MEKNNLFYVKKILSNVLATGFVCYTVIVVVSTPYIYYELIEKHIEVTLLGIFYENLRNCLRFFYIGGGIGFIGGILDIFDKNGKK